LNCSDPGKSLGFNVIYVGQSAAYPIDAGQPLTFMVHGDRGSEITSTKFNDVYCLSLATFAPKPGGRYEAVFQDDGQQCSVELLDVAGGLRQSVPVDRRQYKKPEKPGDDKCPLAR
jgi:hypothetical protein